MEKKTFAALAIKEAIESPLIAAMRYGSIRCLAWILVSLAIHSVVADDELVWSGPGCVLLKNGNVLSAKDVAPQSSHIAVRLDQTGEVRIPKKDVVAIGRDRLELYYYQVSKTTRWGAGEHWQLAKWCLRQGLIEQSQGHYEQLKQLSGDHTKFKQLDSELKHALLQDPVMKAALKSVIPSEQVSSASQASATQFDAQPKPLTSSHPANQESSQRSISTDRYTQDYFRAQIQPFLAMRCGQAGCHGAYGTSNFHVAKNGSLHGQRSNEISLDSTVRFLDNENVEATQLWLKATTTHGLQSAPSLTTKISAERDLLNRLRHWHQSIYRTSTALQMSTMVNFANKQGLASQPPLLAPLAPSSGRWGEGEGRQPKNAFLNGENISPQNLEGMSQHRAATPNASPVVTLPEIGGELLALEREIAKLEEKDRAKKASTRHDPDEFNRRFGGVKP